MSKEKLRKLRKLGDDGTGCVTYIDETGRRITCRDATQDPLEVAAGAKNPTPELKRLKARLRIKDEAHRTIIAAYPEFKQQNMTDRRLDLLEVSMTRALTAVEASELQEIRKARAFIDRVRAEADVAAAALESSPGLSGTKELAAHAS